MKFSHLYDQKLVSAEEAVKIIESKDRVYLGGGAGAPQVLEKAMVGRSDELREVEVVHVMTLGADTYLDEKYIKSFRHRALFIGHSARKMIDAGHANYTPVFLSEIPKLFRDGSLLLDVAMIQVSPPDEHGYCSYGVEVGVTMKAAEFANYVIAEINTQMPRVHGDSFIHLNQLHKIVEVDYPLPEIPTRSFTEEQQKIGKLIAEMIPDGATLQLGIGAIPNAVLANLTDKIDLGIHTELFSDGVISLVESGVITNRRKNLHPGKITAGFLFGSKKLYDFVDDNPMIELRPTDYINDPFIIAQNDDMIAINSAIEVDLTGQVSADSIGARFYSGIGGQVDFVRGAARSKGGKPIIALPSTAKGGEVSRIVPQLKPGAGVVTSRGDVHYVVTEYGVAFLHGRSIHERAEELVKIAHPKFRDELNEYIHKMHWENKGFRNRKSK
jgi:4-hydroxybutyrate CoA-transferase